MVGEGDADTTEPGPGDAVRVRVIELPIGTAVPTEKSTAVTWQTGSKHCSRRNKESKESNRGIVGDASRTKHNNCSKHYSTEKQSPVPRRIFYVEKPPPTSPATHSLQ